MKRYIRSSEQSKKDFTNEERIRLFGEDTEGKIAIPEGYTSIDAWAFSFCRKLTSVIIPNSVTSIGKEAFSFCSGLTSITLPNSVTSIGRAAFSGCSGLTHVKIPDGVTSIDEFSFRDCTNLISIKIPNSVTRIQYGAFEDCTQLKIINIPESIRTIETHAFYGCDNLSHETILKISNLAEATPGNSSMKDLLKLLQSNGIDTTKHKYELKAKTYERYTSGPIYTKKFTCPGNYLAYMSMYLHRHMNSSEIVEGFEDYFGSLDSLPADVATESDMKQYASDHWWGDGDDYIFYLKNLDTGEILYESDIDEEYAVTM